MQVARALVPIPPASPGSQDPCRRPHAEENGCEIDRNNHKAHAAQTKRISSDGTPQRKPRPCRSAAGHRFDTKAPLPAGNAVDIVRVGGLLAMPCPYHNAANAACPRRRKTDLTARPRRAQKCRRNALTKSSILGLKSEGSRTM